MRPVGFGLAKKAPLNQKEVHAFVAMHFGYEPVRLKFGQWKA
jgi:hypothetical protein